jgi:hypothetical protein
MKKLLLLTTCLVVLSVPAHAKKCPADLINSKTRAFNSIGAEGRSIRDQNRSKTNVSDKDFIDCSSGWLSAARRRVSISAEILALVAGTDCVGPGIEDHKRLKAGMEKYIAICAAGGGTPIPSQQAAAPTGQSPTQGSPTQRAEPSRPVAPPAPRQAATPKAVPGSQQKQSCSEITDATHPSHATCRQANALLEKARRFRKERPLLEKSDDQVTGWRDVYRDAAIQLRLAGDHDGAARIEKEANATTTGPSVRVDKDTSKNIPTPQQSQNPVKPAPKPYVPPQDASDNKPIEIPTPTQRSDNLLPPRLGQDGVTVVPQFRNPTEPRQADRKPLKIFPATKEDCDHPEWFGEDLRNTAAYYNFCSRVGGDDEQKQWKDSENAKHYDNLGIHPETPFVPGDRQVSPGLRASAEKLAQQYLEERAKAVTIASTAKGQELLDALEYAEVAARNASIVFARLGNEDGAVENERDANRIGLIRIFGEVELKRQEKLTEKQCLAAADYFSKTDQENEHVLDLMTKIRKKCNDRIRDRLKQSMPYDFLERHPELRWWVQ